MGNHLGLRKGDRTSEVTVKRASIVQYCIVKGVFTTKTYTLLDLMFVCFVCSHIYLQPYVHLMRELFYFHSKLFTIHLR